MSAAPHCIRELLISSALLPGLCYFSSLVRQRWVGINYSTRQGTYRSGVPIVRSQSGKSGQLSCRPDAVMTQDTSGGRAEQDYISLDRRPAYYVGTRPICG